MNVVIVFCGISRVDAIRLFSASDMQYLKLGANWVQL